MSGIAGCGATTIICAGAGASAEVFTCIRAGIAYQRAGKAFLTIGAAAADFTSTHGARLDGGGSRFAAAFFTGVCAGITRQFGEAAALGNTFCKVFHQVLFQLRIPRRTLRSIYSSSLFDLLGS